MKLKKQMIPNQIRNKSREIPTQISSEVGSPLNIQINRQKLESVKQRQEQAPEQQPVDQSFLSNLEPQVMALNPNESNDLSAQLDERVQTNKTFIKSLKSVRSKVESFKDRGMRQNSMR